MEFKNAQITGNTLSKDITKLVVETDEKNPITVVVITNESGIDVKDGYRVRLTPKYTD